MRPYLLPLLLLLLVPTGCTLTFGTATVLDEARAHRAARIAPYRAAEVPPGTAVRLTDTTGAVRVGQLQGTVALPEGPALRLAHGGGEVLVPLAEVARLERRRTPHRLLPALALGGAIDLTLLLLATTQERSPVQLNW